jgi:hypothetical protein
VKGFADVLYEDLAAGLPKKETDTIDLSGDKQKSSTTIKGCEHVGCGKFDIGLEEPQAAPVDIPSTVPGLAIGIGVQSRRCPD